jgi:Zn finger protein HypA/HybF involved in hydrogenase expression
MNNSFVRSCARRLRLLAGRWRDSALVALIVSFAGIPIVWENAAGQSAGETAQAGQPQVSRDAPARRGSMYAGALRCADCHSSIVQTQESTAMGHAALKVSDSDILSANASLLFHDGPYSLQIQRDRDKVVYTASDGHESVSVPLIWAFGMGNAGQTYIFKNDGVYYESRVSYYNEIHGLDLTIGHSQQPQAKLSAELGRPLSKDELKICFSCHTSEDMVEGKLVISSVHPGVTCENCHGPGNDHVQTMESSQVSGNSAVGIFNPGSLRPADVNEFCGKCHRSTSNVLASNIRDVRNVRFQPYRLENSRCYDPTDKRITCLACHDPHKQLVTASETYDTQCQACHAVRGKVPRASQSAPACPTATVNCVSCHMPKTVLPGSHYAFTDHYIRVFHAGERYPE